MTTDEHQIRHLMAEWRRAAFEQDLEAILELMTDDAVFLTPDRPPMTRDDFAAGFRSLAGRARVDVDQEVKEIHAAGELAYAWSHLIVITTSLDTGARTRRSGYALSVFRKEPSGDWRLARDANLLPPGAQRQTVTPRREVAEIAPRESELEPVFEEEEVVVARGAQAWLFAGAPPHPLRKSF